VSCSAHQDSGLTTVHCLGNGHLAAHRRPPILLVHYYENNLTFVVWICRPGMPPSCSHRHPLTSQLNAATDSTHNRKDIEYINVLQRSTEKQTSNSIFSAETLNPAHSSAGLHILSPLPCFARPWEWGT
jgi:hypothetical protein